MTIQALDEVVMSVECNERGGTITRDVSLCELSIENLKFLYEKLSEFPILFNDYVTNDLNSFIDAFVAVQADGSVKSRGIIWLVDDVGILFINGIIPHYEAQAHFTFWDKKIRGRENLILKMLKYLFEEYKFHRIVVQVPLYAPPVMRFVERLGFTKEGRKREATLRDGEWFDVNLYSMIEHEV